MNNRDIGIMVLLLTKSEGSSFQTCSMCCSRYIIRCKRLLLLLLSLAPIGDLEEGQRCRLSDDGDAIQIYLGGRLPTDDENDPDDPYKLSSPSRLLPLMVPSILVGGGKDEDGNQYYLLQSLLLT